jgi:glycerol-3-phosphate acyltransferase PlsX
VRIAIDVVAEASAADPLVEGIIQAGRASESELLLVGDTIDIARSLAAVETESLRISVRHAPNRVASGGAELGLRQPSESLALGLRLLRDGEAEALVTSAPTDDVVARARDILQPIDANVVCGLATIVPAGVDKVVLIDCGAKPRPDGLAVAQFALQGVGLARGYLGIAEPRVGLLSHGLRPRLDDPAVRDGHRLLRASGLHYLGIVEAVELFRGRVNVFACEGAVGDMVISAARGTIEEVDRTIRRATRLRIALAGVGLDRLNERIAPRGFGGAILLGYRQPVVLVSDDGSAERFVEGILGAEELLASSFVQSFEDVLGRNPSLRGGGAKAVPEEQPADDGEGAL